MTSKIDNNESLLFDKLRELCTLCAKGIVEISNETHYPPNVVAKMFVHTFQFILDKMGEDKHD